MQMTYQRHTAGLYTLLINKLICLIGLRRGPQLSMVDLQRSQTIAVLCIHGRARRQQELQRGYLAPASGAVEHPAARLRIIHAIPHHRARRVYCCLHMNALPSDEGCGGMHMWRLAFAYTQLCLPGQAWE